MFKDKEFGLYEYGYSEDIEKIDDQNLYRYYNELLNECKIDIFISGKIQKESEIEQIINKTISEKYLLKIKPRVPNFIENSKERITEDIKEQLVEEEMDVAQGKLVIGLNIKENNSNTAAKHVYNAILGGGANSKLFQNVREKASLAYTAGSGYLKTKDIISIRCGIEVKNYEQAILIIRQQLENMKKGLLEEKDLQNAKELIIGSLQSMKDEQIGEISYELSK